MPMPPPMAPPTAVSMKIGEYAVLEAHLPEQQPAPIGVLLLDCDSQRLALKTRHDWQDIAGDNNTDDAEVLELLAEQIQKLIAT